MCSYGVAGTANTRHRSAAQIICCSDGKPVERGVTGARARQRSRYTTYDTASIAGSRKCRWSCPPHPSGSTAYPGPPESRATPAPCMRAPCTRAPCTRYRGSGVRQSTASPAPPPSKPPRGQLTGERVAVLDTELLGDDVSPADVRGSDAGIVAGPRTSKSPTRLVTVTTMIPPRGTARSSPKSSVIGALAVDVVCHKVSIRTGSVMTADGRTPARGHVVVEGGLPEVISMSFGGYGFDDKMATLARAIRRVHERRCSRAGARRETMPPARSRFPLLSPAWLASPRRSTAEPRLPRPSRTSAIGSWPRHPRRRSAASSRTSTGSMEERNGAARRSRRPLSRP